MLDLGPRAARAAARQITGSLRDNRVNPRTLARYQNAVVMFQWFLASNSLSFARDFDELDSQLCMFLETLWHEGESKGLANDVLSGTQHFLLTRRRFPGAWQLLTTWGRLEIPARAPPISLDIILAIAGFALSLTRIDYVAILLTGFHCILRTMMAHTISPGFVALGSDCRRALALPRK